MTFEQAYERYLVVLQANGITDKVQSDRSRFALNFNKAQNEVQELLIERKNEDDNRYLEKVKVMNLELEKDGSDDISQDFNLPSNYFDLLDPIVYCSSSKCSNQKFFVREVKGENLDEYLTDAFLKPSFKYRESFYILADGKVKVYRDDFEVSKLQLSYYKYPLQIELEDPENPESNFTSGETEFDDKLTERIINLAASQHLLNASDPRYQALKAEVIQKA